MADLEVFRDYVSAVSNTTTAWSTTGPQIAGASFTNGDTYIIIASLAVGTTNIANDVDVQIQLPDGTTKQIGIDVDSAGSYDYLPIGGLFKVTADGSSICRIQHRRSGGSPIYTSWMADISLLIYNVTDLTEDEDWFFSSHSTFGSILTTETTEVSATTFTPAAGEDYAIWGWLDAECDGYSHSVFPKLKRDSTTLGRPPLIEGEDSLERFGILLFAVDEDVAATSRTYSLTSDAEDIYSWDHYGASIFVLRLDAFADHSVASASSYSPTTTAWEEMLSFTHTPTATGDQVLIGWAVADMTSVTEDMQIQIQVDDAGSDNFRVNDARDATDEYWLFLPLLQSIDTGGATVDLDGDRSSAADWYQQYLVAHSVALAGGEPEDQTISPALVSQALATFAPSLTTSVTVSPALADQSTVTFDPVVSQAAAGQQIDPALVDQSTTTFAPTLTPGAVNVTPALAQQLAAPFAPTLTTIVTVSPALADQSATAFNPTLTPGSVTVSPGLATQTATPFDPTLTASVSMSPGLVQQLAAAFDPTVTPGAATVSPGLAQQLAAAFGPTVSSGSVTISPALAQQLATTFAPTFARTIDPALAQQLAVAFDPSLSLGATSITPGLATQVMTAFAPTLTTTVTISPALAQQLAATFAPSFSITITPALADQTAITFDPTLTTGAVTISPGLADQSLVTFAPTVTPGSVTISPGLAQQLAAAFAPGFTIGIEPGLAQQLTVTFDPTLTTGSISFTPGLAQQLITAFDPSVGEQSITPALAQQLAVTFAPSFTMGATSISPGLAQQLVVTFSPLVVHAAVLIDGRAYLYPANVYQWRRITRTNGEYTLVMARVSQGQYEQEAVGEVASRNFVLWGPDDFTLMDTLASPVWEFFKNAPIATLKTAIDDRLDSAGIATSTTRDAKSALDRHSVLFADG